MVDKTFLDWPFFGDCHRALARDLETWCEHELPNLDFDEGDLDATCRAFALKLGKAGWLRYAVPKRFGEDSDPSGDDKLDVRSICLIRETIARYSGLGEFIFAMQGLGSCPITQFGSEKLKNKYLPGVAQGKSIAAFAISEAAAGSDISAMTTTARRSGSGYVIDGEKTWISNGGIASHYVVFCRLPEVGEKSFIALMVDADNPGLSVSERIKIIAPHPLATLKFNACHVSEDAVVGKPGDGIRIAHATLDVFRPTVGAAALGLARRALNDSITHCGKRHLFGQKLSDFQITQAKLADMATSIDASALLVYRAAWTRDHGAERITREAAMAKLFATEAAQRIIDDAVQLFGSRGVVAGETMERLYREVRALRIYEGASEVQKLIIASQILKPEKKADARRGNHD